MKWKQRKLIVGQIKQRYEVVEPYLTEHAKRIWAVSEALAVGYGGVTIVCEATGISRATINKGRKELDAGLVTDCTRVRREGGGRKKLVEHDPKLLEDLDELIDPCTRGDPQSPLRWTCKSTYKIAEALQEKGHVISQSSVYALLSELHYSLQSNRKTKEGKGHVDRDAQFQNINSQVKSFHSQGQPVISVDAKKKENIGNYANSGREWEKQGQPKLVNMHDFPDKKKGKACPYGVYDICNNEGWMNVGISHDTAEFAVESIRRWWKHMGVQRYPKAHELLITADGGGSNGYRTKLWKREIQSLSNELRLRIHVCHFPPGTSKWNKIEHRMFSFVTKNWRGRPLDSLASIVNLIADTKTDTGLHIEACVDENSYENGIKISNEEMENINIEIDDFHGEWNYTISPNYENRRKVV
jgi:transposase